MIGDNGVTIINKKWESTWEFANSKFNSSSLSAINHAQEHAWGIDKTFETCTHVEISLDL